MDAMSGILKIYFETFLLNPKGQLTRNLMGGIGATCRSKVDHYLASKQKTIKNQFMTFYLPLSIGFF